MNAGAFTLQRQAGTQHQWAQTGDCKTGLFLLFINPFTTKQIGMLLDKREDLPAPKNCLWHTQTHTHPEVCGRLTNVSEWLSYIHMQNLLWLCSFMSTFIIERTLFFKKKRYAAPLRSSLLFKLRWDTSGDFCVAAKSRIDVHARS